VDGRAQTKAEVERMNALSTDIRRQSRWNPRAGSRRRYFCFLWLVAMCFHASLCYSQVTIFSENFEGSFPISGAWTVGDDDPFGTTAYWSSVDAAFGGEGTHGGSRKAYCSGIGFGGTIANPTYQSDMTAFMSRTINLGGLSAASLTFWYKLPSLEECCERPRVWIDNTLVWTTSTAVGAWTQVTVSLNGLVGGLRTLRFEFVSDSSVVFEGWYVDDVLVTGTAGMGPPNDSFNNAYVISGTAGSTNGTSTGATKEAGEPSHAGNTGGKSVWYRWTPAVSGTAIIDTTGSAFDTLLAVYTGTDVAALTMIDSNNDISVINPRSRVTFSVIAGTTYRIAVDGRNGDSGAVVLNWNEVTGPPVNDSFSSAIIIAGSSGSTNGTNINATKQSGEPNHAGNTGGSSIWYRWTPTTGGQVTFNTLGSTFDTLLGVYTGSTVSGLTVVATNDDVSVNYLQSQVTFTALAGTTYRIAVDGYNGDVGMLTLNWAQGGPANDAFANAFALGGQSGTTNGNNFNASMEQNEPVHADEPGGHSVWYKWTAPTSGPFVFDTGGSALDTLLAVYTGSQLNNLSLVAANHYGGTMPESRLDFQATAGTVYRIAVDGFDGAQWTFRLNWHSQTQPRFLSIARAPAGALVTLTGAAGDRYEIQSSSNLVSWTPLLILTNATGTVQFTDPSATNLTHRFYQALLEP
jgi:hypothetical protein